MSKLTNITGIITCTLFLASCNPGEQGTDSVSGLKSIAGIYDWSDDYGTAGYDEWYLGIDEEGNVSDYDYNGDSYDQGSNCYYIDLNWDKITYISGNRFNSQVAGDATVTLTSDSLTIDFDDEDYGTLVLGEKTNLVQSDLLAANCVTASAMETRSYSAEYRLNKFDKVK